MHRSQHNPTKSLPFGLISAPIAEILDSVVIRHHEVGRAYSEGLATLSFFGASSPLLCEALCHAVFWPIDAAMASFEHVVIMFRRC